VGCIEAAGGLKSENPNDEADVEARMTKPE